MVRKWEKPECEVWAHLGKNETFHLLYRNPWLCHATFHGSMKTHGPTFLFIFYFFLGNEKEKSFREPSKVNLANEPSFAQGSVGHLY